MRTTQATYVEFGLNTLELEAVKSFGDVTGIGRVESAGYIALLVALGIAQADDDGQIDHLTDKTIETACGWQGERGTLINAFVESGILTGERDSDTNPLTIERGLWETLAGKAIKKRTDARKRKARERAAKR